MADFFPVRTGPVPEMVSTQSGSKGVEPTPSTSNSGKGGTPLNRRGFNYCNTKSCRYCPLLNKTGSIKCPVTGRRYTCMKNVSCRSSNLIYCINCKRCNKQYVGQTSLRLKNRFVHHLYSIDKEDQSKPVGKHFSSKSHEGIDDVEIFVLEFIKKPPTSQVGGMVRDRVERRWIHLLRSIAPQGLNIDD
jgi:hypothetical protein